MAWQQQPAGSQSRGHWWPSPTTPSQQEASWLAPSQRKGKDAGIMPKPTTHGCLETFENYIENSDFYEEQHERRNKPKLCFKSAFSQSQRCCHGRVPASQKSCRALQVTFGQEVSRFSQVQAVKRDLPPTVNLSGESKITQRHNISMKEGKERQKGNVEKEKNGIPVARCRPGI